MNTQKESEQKTKASPAKPIMEINKENSIWIAHCVNKKSKKPMGLAMYIKISNSFVGVILTQNGQEISVAESTHDINEAIDKVKEAFGVNNMLRVLSKQNNPIKQA